MPLHDKELDLLSKEKNKFKEIGVEVIVSDLKVIEICNDKYKTYKFLKDNQFDSPETFLSLENNISFPAIIKDRYGSASKNIKKVNTFSQLKSEFLSRKSPIIQNYINGEEYGIECFFNNKNEPVSIYCKKKLGMRAGETDKAISVYEEDLLNYIEVVGLKLKAYGPIDFDIIKNESKYYIIDINPRFGGGYPMAHAQGANFTGKIVDMLNGKELKLSYDEYKEGIIMMKDIKVIIK